MPPQRTPQGYAPVGRHAFLRKLTPILSPRGLEQVMTAYILAKYGHMNQMREVGHVRYFEHPKSVAWILVNELRVDDAETIVMALLHDTLEDSHILTPYRIELNFGKQVVVGLQLLTKKPKPGYVARLVEYASAKVLLVKLADRLHNLRTLYGCTKTKQRDQIQETKQYYLPLALHLRHLLPAKDRWRADYLEREIRKCIAEYEK
ncbi:MAG: HD domain-containing protein [bacterium]|nr:HD domain-containing protein [bacterium]